MAAAVAAAPAATEAVVPVEADASGKHARKRAARASRNETYRNKLKKQTITVTLAQLEDPSFRLAEPKQRRAAAAAGVRISLNKDFKAADQRKKIIEAMKDQQMSEIVLPGQAAEA